MEIPDGTAAALLRPSLDKLAAVTEERDALRAEVLGLRAELAPVSWLAAPTRAGLWWVSCPGLGVGGALVALGDDLTTYTVCLGVLTADRSQWLWTPCEPPAPPPHG